jgi:hypothetical protein
MAEEIVTEQEETNEESREESPSPEEKGDKRENMIPQSRFNEVNERAKAAALEVAELKAAQAKAQEEKLIEQEKYKELAESRGEELAAAKAKAARYDSANEALEKVLEVQMDAIPENLRGLVPEALDTQSKLAYIAQNAAVLSKAPAIDVKAGKRGGEKDDTQKIVLTAEQKQAAANAGVTEEEYAKYI